jgi:caffeoyl-CoA O-methyltransferase
MGAPVPPPDAGQLAPIFVDVERYIAGLFAAEDGALAGVTRTIEEAGMPQISVSPVEGKLLHLLVRLTDARRILELGTLGGYSTIWMARALPEDGELVSLEISPKYAEVARRNLERAGVLEQVDIRVGAALDVLPEMYDEDPSPFDLVFIDADKPPYLEYFRWALRFSRRGTLIVADNVIRDGEVLDPNTGDDKVRGVQRFNAALAAEPRVTAVILQTVGMKGHDGMALAVVSS